MGRNTRPTIIHTNIQQRPLLLRLGQDDRCDRYILSPLDQHGDKNLLFL